MSDNMTQFDVAVRTGKDLLDYARLAAGVAVVAEAAGLEAVKPDYVRRAVVGNMLLLGYLERAAARLKEAVRRDGRLVGLDVAGKSAVQVAMEVYDSEAREKEETEAEDVGVDIAPNPAAHTDAPVAGPAEGPGFTTFTSSTAGL